MTIDYNLMGRRIAEIRKKRGLTQEKLAEMADLTNNFISHIETCRSIPSLETIVKLCDALSVTPDEILLGTGTASPEYLSSDIIQKLETCSPSERRLVNGFIDLLLSQRNAK
ncbi:helix-turn-helix domain-containing protein [Anaerotruncus rubiinfantis]|uniref:helix-turn-helix domain-containing protein n=1 Tax=Anaerotruncus rubiinfantis TaxID=1720200 RepID=UPI000834BA1F|nr:helix-turn-helix transcriptional regulator [Anaerotruncus rubiinfantis]